MNQLYSPIRALHLYFGLFTSPFILVFAISVLVINHPGFFSGMNPEVKTEDIHRKLEVIPFGETDLVTAKAIINELGLTGEIDFISRTDSLFSFPLNKPGLINRVTVNTSNGDVLISQSDEGFFRGTRFLHMMPGQHNAMMRGNSGFMKVWRLVTDSIVYLMLFLSASGIFLWYFLRPDRKLGLYALSFGLITLIVLVFLLF